MILAITYNELGSNGIELTNVEEGLSPELRAIVGKDKVDTIHGWIEDIKDELSEDGTEDRVCGRTLRIKGNDQIMFLVVSGFESQHSIVEPAVVVNPFRLTTEPLFPEQTPIPKKNKKKDNKKGAKSHRKEHRTDRAADLAEEE